MAEDEWEKELEVVESSNEYVCEYAQDCFEGPDHPVVQISASSVNPKPQQPKPILRKEKPITKPSILAPFWTC
jgi:hypothetical protein